MNATFNSTTRSLIGKTLDRMGEIEQAEMVRAPEGESDSIGSIFARFLKIGLLAWGGPAAQIAMIKQECVDQERWITEDAFKRILAVYQVLPGPEAHQLCVYFGRVRGGKRGGFLAGLGFMLPGFALMLALSILYVEVELSEHLGEIFYGLSAAVGALIARALVRLSLAFITSSVLAVIAATAFGLSLLTPVSFVIVLAGAGIAHELWRNAGRWAGGARAVEAGPGLVVGAIATGAIALPLIGTIFFVGLKTGLLAFGGAFTVIPLLQGSAVEAQGWLTNEQFVDGLAMVGVLPAPLIVFSTFVGYLAGGLTGSLAMTVAIFIPAFALPIFLHRYLIALAHNRLVRPFLDGVAAGVIGLIAAVAVVIVETGVVDLPSAILAIGAFLALMRWHSKLTVLYVVLGCGLIGAALQLTVL